ncbi:MAG: SCO family protein [Myxococcaceae bacterium]|nr:SCO family protein [Myxococcaceae bacterium]
MAKWLTLVGVLALFTIALLAYVKVRSPSKLERAEALAHAPKKALEPLFPAPAFAYPDQHGATVTTQTLGGKVWVANFIFTTCRTICPLLSARMVQLQRALKDADVRFVSFSVDPEHDTPEVLAAYARKWAPDEPRWALLATDAKTLPLTAAGFHVTAEKNKPGELDPILHSSVFVLVDKAGMVRGVFDSEHREDLKALEQAVRTFAGAPAPAPEQGAPSGVELYHAQSCATCHEAPELAPPLLGRAGSRVSFDNGLVATFDADYVKESLLAPDAKRAKGYPLHMPAYDHLSAEALLVLTKYVLETSAEGPSPTAEVPVEVDPVCHMKVRAVPDALSSVHEGKRFFFCSKHCLTRFTATPLVFLPTSPDAGAMP